MKKQIKEPINLRGYGKYRMGLTKKEIQKYLKQRAGVKRLGNLYKKFSRIAGVNTMAVEYTDCCKKEIILMYRWDVERFAMVMFEGIPTYFD